MAKLKKWLIFAFLLLTLTACQTPQAPLNYSETWKTSESEKISKEIDPVWEYLRKKEIIVSEPLNLIELIDIALFNNPSTRQAWQETRVKEALARQAESQSYPQLALSAKGQRERADANQAAADLNEFKYGPSSQLTYLLLDFGGRKAQAEEAALKLLAANFQFNQALQDLLLEVETAYYTLYSSQANLQTAEINLKEAKMVLEATEKKFAAGLASKLDQLKAESNSDNALYSLENAKGKAEEARGNLANVLGFPAGIKLEVAPPLNEIPLDITPKDVNLLIQETLVKKPNIISLRKNLQAEQAAVQVANSALWPEFTLGGEAGKNWYKYYGVKQERNNDSDYAGYLNVTWDIFDGFYNLNEKKSRAATVDAERQKLIEAELEAALNVWVKYYEFRTALKKYTFSKADFNTAKTSYELASESYSNGLKDILDLLKAQNSLSEARSNLVESEKDLFIGLAGLAHATGSLGVERNNITTANLNNAKTEDLNDWGK